MCMTWKTYCPKIIHLIILFLALSVCSCEKMDRIKDIYTIRRMNGKVLDLSGLGDQILKDTTYKAYTINKKLTIVSYIDNKLCPECFAKYLKVAESFINLFDSEEIQYVCIAYPRPLPDLQRAVSLSDVDSSKVMVIYDVNNVFRKNNNIKRTKLKLCSFMIGSDHKIITTGDPIRNVKMYNYCKEIIESVLHPESGMVIQ